MGENQEGKKKALDLLMADIEGAKKSKILSWNEYLDLVVENPEKVLRNIFRLFPDEVKSNVGEGVNEYADDPESIGFVDYDCSKLFVNESSSPYFADRLFANRFIRQIGLMGQGSQQNKIYVYEGPHGCGKSTFLNNLLRSFEKYTNSEEGRGYEIFWDIKTEEEEVQVPCPSHDYPMLVIPKNKRKEYIDLLLSGHYSSITSVLSEKDYEWLFDGEICTICGSLFYSLLNKLGSIEKVMEMVKVRHRIFDRRLGEGISVFNPSDKPMREQYLSDKEIQEKLNKIFGGNYVKYVFSQYAKTNNGIYVLMDVKEHNKDRFTDLHNIISEGVHKVNGIIEERISSLFFALMNPEDKETIEGENLKSLRGRVIYEKVPNILDVPTEIKMYCSIFGNQMKSLFLPGVLENFSRIIISSRMNPSSKALKEWIPDMTPYKRYCDPDGILLRMEIYAGIIPTWLLSDDRKKLTANIRRKLIAEGGLEGEKGFSGRQAIRRFGEFLKYYSKKDSLINMGDVKSYFISEIKNKSNSAESVKDMLPDKIIISVINGYNYQVLSQVKESLYFFNEEQISEDILHYLMAVNHDVGSKIKCTWTGKEIEVSSKFLRTVGSFIANTELDDEEAERLSQEVQKKYVKLIASGNKKPITESRLYQELHKAYVSSLKEKILDPFVKNENFVEAIKCFGDKSFKSCEPRLQEHVSRMISNLVNKFNYTERGAKEICVYVIDQKLVERFS